jgi:aspartate 1-decarboxylase
LAGKDRRFGETCDRRARRALEKPFTAMQFYLLKSKIHRASVTGGNVDYEGSLTIARDLMEQAGLLPYERILCSNMANGKRFETYAIPGKRGSGEIVLNGAAARLGKRGDRLTIMSFTNVSQAKAKRWTPRVIVLSRDNRIVNERGI